MYHEGKVKVTRLNEKGEEKMVTEHYIIDNAQSFAEAELKLSEYVSADNVEYDVFFLCRSKIMETVNEKKDGMPYFKATITATYMDEYGKETEKKYQVLVCAADINEANTLMDDYIRQGLNDMRLDGIVKTKILDIV